MLSPSHRETKQKAAARWLQSGDYGIRQVSELVQCSTRTAYRAQHDIRAVEGESRLDRVEARVMSLEARVNQLAGGSRA